MSFRHPPSCVWHRVWHRRQYAFAGVHDTQIQRTPISTTSLNVFSPSSAGRRLSDEEVPSWASDNPDLDEVVLDDAYYEEIGMTREQAMRQQQELMYSVDPEAMPLDEMASVSQDLPEEWRKAIENLEVYGPQALLMAGFRAEEYAVARATLDSLGAHQVKVLPVSQEMLQLPLELAVQQEEIDWSSPRPPQWIMGGAWGSQRTLMFSGLSIKVQATLIELLEAQGLPSVCVTMALQDDAHRKLGDLLAAAVKAQRQAKPSPSIPPWEVPRKANPPPPSSTAASTAGPPSHSAAAAAASAGDVKRAIAASLPGRKGPLFGGSNRSSRSSWSHQGGSSAAPDGLEPLQQLIPPDIARLRLQADPNAEPAGIADLLDLDIPFEDDDSSTGSGSPGSSSPGAGSSSSSSSTQQPLQDVEDKTQALVDWFTNEADGSPAVELPWEEDEGAQSSRKAAAAGAGFSQVEQWQQQQAAPAPTPAAAAGGAGSSSSGVILAAAEQPAEVLLDDLLPPGGVGDMAVATAGNGGSINSSDGSMQLPRSPRAAAAAGGFDSPVGGTAAAVGGSESSGGSSMLAAIQAALKSGVNPEQLKQLIDSAAAAAAAASDPIDLMMQDETEAEKAASSNETGPTTARQANPAAANGRANSAGSPPQQQQPQQPSKPRPFGPELPPATPQDDAEPLLKLRPEIERAFQNNQVKFVDINKFPKKYKQQYTLAAMQERQRQQQQMQLRQLQHQQQQQVGADGDDSQDLPGEPAPPAAAAAAADTSPHQAQQQQQQRGRWWQQRQQHSQSLAAKALSELPTGGKLVEVDVADGSLTELTSDAMATAPDKQLTEMQLQEQSDTVFEDEVQAAEDAQYYAYSEAADEDEDEDEAAAEEPIELDEAKLRLLVQSAEQEALDVSRTLAEALAFGVKIPPEVAAAVGVPLPTADQVEAAKEEIVNNIRQMQRHQQEGDVTTSTAMSEQEWAAAGASSSSSSSSVQQQAAEAALVVQQQQQHLAAGVKGRTWGSGLSSAVSRARARLAEKKRLQDGQH